MSENTQGQTLTPKSIMKDGIWHSNPVSCQMLGVCSALAVSGKVANSLVMSAALLFVAIMSNVLVSLLRKITPRKIRMIAEVAIIATFVILFDMYLKAYQWEMSKELGPYVSLIITNCIIMGRAEAFAMHNGLYYSLIDGIANGFGFALILVLVAVMRELVGLGTILGFEILSPSWYTDNLLMVMAPGAFIATGLVIAILNGLTGREPE